MQLVHLFKQSTDKILVLWYSCRLKYVWWQVALECATSAAPQSQEWNYLRGHFQPVNKDDVMVRFAAGSKWHRLTNSWSLATYAPPLSALGAPCGPVCHLNTRISSQMEFAVHLMTLEKMSTSTEDIIWSFKHGIKGRVLVSCELENTYLLSRACEFWAFTYFNKSVNVR